MDKEVEEKKGSWKIYPYSSVPSSFISSPTGNYFVCGTQVGGEGNTGDESNCWLSSVVR